MSLTFNEAFVVGIIVFVLVTLILFGFVTWEKYNPKHVFWNRMNALAAFGIFMTLSSIIPQLFLAHRTYGECFLIHHWAGSFYHFTNSLTHVYFIARSNMVVQHNLKQVKVGRWLFYMCIFFAVFDIVGLNIIMSVDILQPNDVCVSILSPFFSLIFGIIIPMLFEIVINARFIYFIMDTSRAVGTINESTQRLLLLTCILCFMTMLSTFITTLILLRIIPLSDPSMLTPILGLEQAYMASMMAWPSIIVRLMKAIRDSATRLDLGSKTNGSKNATAKNPFASEPPRVYVEPSTATGPV